MKPSEFWYPRFPARLRRAVVGWPLAAKGAGDAFAALFLGFWLARPSPREALERAVAATYGLVAATSASGGDELALVEAQNLITRPPRRFRARRIG